MLPWVPAWELLRIFFLQGSSEESHLQVISLFFFVFTFGSIALVTGLWGHHQEVLSPGSLWQGGDGPSQGIPAGWLHAGALWGPWMLVGTSVWGVWVVFAVG